MLFATQTAGSYSGRTDIYLKGYTGHILYSFWHIERRVSQCLGRQDLRQRARLPIASGGIDAHIDDLRAKVLTDVSDAKKAQELAGQPRKG